MTYKGLLSSLLLLGVSNIAAANSLPQELSNPFLTIDTTVAHGEQDHTAGSAWSGSTVVRDDEHNTAEMELSAYGEADADYVDVSWMNEGVAGWTRTSAVLHFTVLRDVKITFEGVVSAAQSPFGYFPSLYNEDGGQQLYDFSRPNHEMGYYLEAGRRYRVVLRSQYTPGTATGGQTVVWRFRIGDPPQPCPADLNGDSQVDGADLVQILSLWGTSSSAGDLDGDGVVDAADLTILLSEWGSCS